MDNRQARRMFDKMGLSMNEIKNVKKVIIQTVDRELLLEGASVFEIKAKDTRVFQVTAQTVTEAALTAPKYIEDDVVLVMTSAGVNREKAIVALDEADGDIALAILRLKP